MYQPAIMIPLEPITEEHLTTEERALGIESTELEVAARIMPLVLLQGSTTFRQDKKRVKAFWKLGSNHSTIGSFL